MAPGPVVRQDGAVTAAADLSLRHSTFFRLLQLVNLTAKPFARLHERRHRISLTEWRVLLGLADQPGISAAEIGELLGLDKMAISRAVRALETQGRLERTPDPNDARRASLRLTEAGSALHREIMPSAVAREAEMFSVLCPAERAQLDALLDRLLTQARALTPPG